MMLGPFLRLVLLPFPFPDSKDVLLLPLGTSAHNPKGISFLARVTLH